MRRFTAPALVVVLVGSSTALAQDLRISCPPGTRAVLESETTVLCRPAQQQPAQPPPIQGRIVGQPNTVVITQPAPTPPPSSPTGMELMGLHAVPEVCGLGALDDDTVEAAKEAFYLGVNACMEQTDVVAPTKPPRWVAFKVEAVSEKTHAVTAPNEDWAAPLQSCLLRRPPKLPKAVRGRTFTAYYKLVSTPQDRPPPPSCVGSR